MEQFTKDSSLLNGKGEDDGVDWITVKGNHIPIKDGETPKEAIKKHFDKNAKVNSDNGKYSPEFKQQVQRLAYTLTKVAENKYKFSKLEMKKLVNDIINFKPIKLKIGDKEIVAEFDKFGAKKNVYTQGQSNIEGYKYKLSNIDKLPSYIATSTYLRSAKEQGKTTPQHKGVIEWHYFINEINTDKGTFDILINVRDKGFNQYIYEVSFNKK